MSRRVINSPENARTSVVLERRGLSRLAAQLTFVAGLAVSSILTSVYVSHNNDREPQGTMVIDPAPDVAPTTKLPKAEPPEIPEEEQQRQILKQYEENNRHLTERLEAQNQVAELVNYRLACGEGQDVFWGTVSIYDTKERQELANITNPIVVTPRSMGWNLEDDTSPYAVVGIVPGKPSASAMSPYQKITPDAFVIDDRDVLAIFTDREGNVATYPNMDIQTLEVSDQYIRNVAPTARYDLAGDIYSLQFADGSAIGLMNPVSHAVEAAG